VGALLLAVILTRYVGGEEVDLTGRWSDRSGKLAIRVSGPMIISSRVTHPELGAHEQPHLFKMPNGDVLCVMRTDGHLPLMQARSTDGGRSWQKPTPTGSLGVDPDLCLMTGGVLACSYGRPGNRIMFSADGTGRQWTDRIQIYEYRDGSFGYTGIVEVEPGRLLFVVTVHGDCPDFRGRRLRKRDCPFRPTRGQAHFSGRPGPKNGPVPAPCGHGLRLAADRQSVEGATSTMVPAAGETVTIRGVELTAVANTGDQTHDTLFDRTPVAVGQRDFPGRRAGDNRLAARAVRG
jgi:hypothetical protein